MLGPDPTLTPEERSFLALDMSGYITVALLEVTGGRYA
jgi:hypothetical protein